MFIYIYIFHIPNLCVYIAHSKYIYVYHTLFIGIDICVYVCSLWYIHTYIYTQTYSLRVSTF